MFLDLNIQSRGININNFLGKDADATKMKVAPECQLSFFP